MENKCPDCGEFFIRAPEHNAPDCCEFCHRLNQRMRLGKVRNPCTEAIAKARREMFERTREEAAQKVEDHMFKANPADMNEADKFADRFLQRSAADIRALALADVAPEQEETCTTWDATNGLRCIEDGCTHNAVGGFLCPHHED